MKYIKLFEEFVTESAGEFTKMNSPYVLYNAIHDENMDAGEMESDLALVEPHINFLGAKSTKEIVYVGLYDIKIDKTFLKSEFTQSKKIKITTPEFLGGSYVHGRSINIVLGQLYGVNVMVFDTGVEFYVYTHQKDYKKLIKLVTT